jgi:hypothetical protein
VAPRAGNPDTWAEDEMFPMLFLILRLELLAHIAKALVGFARISCRVW